MKRWEEWEQGGARRDGRQDAGFESGESGGVGIAGGEITIFDIGRKLAKIIQDSPLCNYKLANLLIYMFGKFGSIVDAEEIS